MKLLIVGAGGREKALYNKGLSSKFTKIYQCPYNSCFENSLDLNTNDEIVDFAKNNQIDLVIIGPENFLYNDLATELTNENIKVFGPSKKGAKIEWSKSYAKDLMTKYNIKTALYSNFSEKEGAIKFLDECDFPIVIKEDGLASGKGVYILDDYKTAVETIDELFEVEDCKIVIEEFLVGEELSVFALVDGDRYEILPIMKDYKKIYDNDKGPNTGGMGARTFNKYDDYIKKMDEEIIKPTVDCLVKEGIHYTGIIYYGLMYSKEDFYVIEYNARFGDPETEVLLEKLESNVIDLINDFLDKKNIEIKTNPEEYIGVVLASKGYPNEYPKGMAMTFDDVNLIEMNMVFENGIYKANGGRVAIIINKGKDIEKAKENVYNDINKINFDNMYYRKDIGR